MKKLLLMAAAIAIGSANAMAAGTDLSSFDNALYVKDASVSKGKTATLSLQLKNKLTNVQSIGAYITLPAGVTVTNATLVDRANPSVTKTGAESNFVQTNLVGNVTRFALLGCSGEAISGNEGDIVTLEVNVDESVAAGTYEIAVSNIELCTLDSKATVIDGEITSELTVTAGLKGDVNEDGAVDAEDLSIVISVMRGQAENAKADINGDGAIDAEDISTIISIMRGIE